MRHWSSSGVIRDVGGADGGETDCMPINGLAGRCGCHALARIVTAQRDSIPGTANRCDFAPYGSSSSPAAGLTCRYPLPVVSSSAKWIVVDASLSCLLRKTLRAEQYTRAIDRISHLSRARPREYVHACWRRRPASCSSRRAPVAGQSSARAGRHVGVPSGPQSVRLETAGFGDSRCPAW
jgi:hypothetical protein